MASLLRLQARSLDDGPAEKALGESVNRILSIAAVHDLLTVAREDDVECAELIGRLESMLGQGLGGREVESRWSRHAVGPARDRAGAGLLRAVLERARARPRPHRRGACALGRPRRAGVADEGGGPHADRRDGLGLTIARGAGARGAARPAGAAGRGGGTIPGRVLIAEDETIIRLDVRAMLERAGFEVVAEARDGEEAVELAAQHEPDLAVMDVKMPGLDGIEAARRMLERRSFPIVMLTAFSESDLVGAGGRRRRVRLPGQAVSGERPAARDRGRPGARTPSWPSCGPRRPSLREALDARKVIERAKGLLMDRDGIGEAEAFERMRRASQMTGTPMREIAEAVVAAFGV